MKEYDIITSYHMSEFGTMYVRSEHALVSQLFFSVNTW